MKYTNMTKIQNWKDVENIPFVYDLYSYSQDDVQPEFTLEQRFDLCDIKKVTGNPERCTIGKTGKLKGFQVYLDSHSRKYYTVFELTVATLGADFPNFLSTLLANFTYNDGMVTAESNFDLSWNTITLASKNYGYISRYNQIPNKSLKKWIGNDRDIQKVMLELYNSAINIKWSVAPTDSDSPCTRLSAEAIAKSTNLSVNKVRNIIKLLRFMRAISEVGLDAMSKPYYERYIDTEHVWQHTPVYVLYDIENVEWDVANQLGFSSSTRLNQAAIRIWFSDEVARNTFAGKRDDSLQFPIMQQFKEIISGYQQAGTQMVLPISTIIDTASANLLSTNEVQNAVPLKTMKGAWTAFAIFLPLTDIQLLTASQAKKQGIQTEATGRSKVLLIG